MPSTPIVVSAPTSARTARDRFDVVAGLDLALQAPIARVDVGGRERAQLVLVGADPDRDPGIDFGAHAAEVRAQRLAVSAQRGVAQRTVKRGSCKWVTAYVVEPNARERAWDQVVAEHHARGIERLRGVASVLLRLRTRPSRRRRQ